ncbi:uncharacterized protein LOC143254614 isoform X2 [Tachypleus tridentatus]|uniref:uncharacterized protein LOC143254614 isoform X2 n=1 Tax=Tachypleus tridentatus TaxID=6853 RepID=UPI003FD4C85F
MTAMITASRLSLIFVFVVIWEVLSTESLDCRTFVFAPICRGISAKRSETPSFGYSSRDVASLNIYGVVQPKAGAKSSDHNEGWNTWLQDVIKEKEDEKMSDIRNIKQDQRHLVSKCEDYALLHKLFQKRGSYNPFRQYFSELIESN